MLLITLGLHSSPALFCRRITLLLYSPLLGLSGTLRRSSRTLLSLHITLLNLRAALLLLPNSSRRFSDSSRASFASRPCKSRLRRLSMIGVVELRPIACRRLASRRLSTNGSYMRLTRGSKL